MDRKKISFFLFNLLLLLLVFLPTGCLNSPKAPSHSDTGKKETISENAVRNSLEKANALKNDLKDYRGAKEEYLGIIEYSSVEPATQTENFIDAHKSFIDCEKELKRFEEAVEYYREKIKKEPSVPGWHFGLALCYLPDISYEITEDTLVKLEEVTYGDNKIFNDKEIKNIASLKGKKYLRQDLLLDLEHFRVNEYKCEEILKHAARYNQEIVVTSFNTVLTLTNEKRPFMYNKTEALGKEYGLIITPGIKTDPYPYLFALLAFAAIASVVYFFLQKGVIEKIIKLEGNFEVFSPGGLKVYILECSDKKFLKKGGDRIAIGTLKGCDFRLKIKGEKKIYAVISAERIEERNRVVITPVEGEELFLEVPKTRYTPDETVKLPFRGGPLWDKDIINIKDYQIHYHSVKLGKRLWKDYPEEARGYIFFDDKGEIEKIEVPDADLFKQVSPPEEDDYYEPYEKIKEEVANIMSEAKEEEDEEDEEEYEIEPMEEKYIEDALFPTEKEIASDQLLTYKIEEDDEEEYEFETLPEISPSQGDKNLLIYPGEEEEEYEFEVLAPVEKEAKKSKDVLLYPEEEEEEYEFEVTENLPTSENKENLLSYPVPDEEDNELLFYPVYEEETIHISEEESGGARKKLPEEATLELERYPSILVPIENLPEETPREAGDKDRGNIELPEGEIIRSLVSIETPKKEEKKEEGPDFMKISKLKKEAGEFIFHAPEDDKNDETSPQKISKKKKKKTKPEKIITGENTEVLENDSSIREKKKTVKKKKNPI